MFRVDKLSKKCKKVNTFLINVDDKMEISTIFTTMSDELNTVKKE